MVSPLTIKIIIGIFIAIITTIVVYTLIRNKKTILSEPTIKPVNKPVPSVPSVDNGTPSASNDFNSNIPSTGAIIKPVDKNISDALSQANNLAATNASKSVLSISAILKNAANLENLTNYNNSSPSPSPSSLQSPSPASMLSQDKTAILTGIDFTTLPLSVQTALSDLIYIQLPNIQAVSQSVILDNYKLTQTILESNWNLLNIYINEQNFIIDFISNLTNSCSYAVNEYNTNVKTINSNINDVNGTNGISPTYLSSHTNLVTSVYNILYNANNQMYKNNMNMSDAISNNKAFFNWIAYHNDHTTLYSYWGGTARPGDNYPYNINGVNRTPIVTNNATINNNVPDLFNNYYACEQYINGVASGNNVKTMLTNYYNFVKTVYNNYLIPIIGSMSNVLLPVNLNKPYGNNTGYLNTLIQDGANIQSYIASIATYVQNIVNIDSNNVQVLANQMITLMNDQNTITAIKNGNISLSFVQGNVSNILKTSKLNVETANNYIIKTISSTTVSNDINTITISSLTGNILGVNINDISGKQWSLVTSLDGISTNINAFITYCQTISNDYAKGVNWWIDYFNKQLTTLNNQLRYYNQGDGNTIQTWFLTVTSPFDYATNNPDLQHTMNGIGYFQWPNSWWSVDVQHIYLSNTKTKTTQVNGNVHNMSIFANYTWNIPNGTYYLIPSIPANMVVPNANSVNVANILNGITSIPGGYFR